MEPTLKVLLNAPKSAFRVIQAGSFPIMLAAVALVGSSSATAQPFLGSHVTVRATRTISDSLIEFAPKPSVQFVRQSDGHLLAGPIAGQSIVKSIPENLSHSTPFMRRGHGPGEATNGIVIIAAAAGNRSVVASLDPQRGVLFDANGKIEIQANSIMLPDGVGYCSGTLLVSGLESGGPQDVQGVFKLRPGSHPELVYPLRLGNARRPANYYTQLMSIVDDRVLVGRPNSTSVVVTGNSCSDFQELKVRIPWFKPWEIQSTAMAWEAPIQPIITGVRWFNHEIGMLLIVRARAGATYTGAKQSTGEQLNRTPPTKMDVWVETVLVIFDSRTGAIRSEVVLPRTGWSFLSNSEIMHHNFDPIKEYYEVFTVDYKGS